MKRSAREQTDSASSLFPFLAVLLCTMGALIVLLVTLGQVARDRAVARAEQQEAAAPEQAAETVAAQERLDRLAERSVQAAAWRRDIDERLTAERAQLRSVDDHIRRMQEEADGLFVEMEELQALDREHYDDERIAAAELERLTAQEESLEREVAGLEQEVAESQQVVLMPPVNGKTGTRRPPVYFECTPTGVVLMPEGIEFDVSDTLAPEAANPFVAAVNACEQYYLEYPSAYNDGQTGSPYPLLVSKARGVRSMERLQHVFDSVGIVYGYETVPEDWNVGFGVPDAELSRRIQQAVRVARVERERLAQQAPELFMKIGSGFAAIGGVPSGSASRSGVGLGAGEKDAGGGLAGSTSGSGREPGEGALAKQPSADQSDSDPANGQPRGAAGGPDAGGPGGGASKGRAVAAADASAGGGYQFEDLQAAKAAAGKLSGQGNPRSMLPLVRTIGVELHRTHLYVLKEGAASSAEGWTKRVDLPQGIRGHTDEVVAALSAATDAWGEAGRGMVWRPEIVINVESGAEAQRAPLVGLLRFVGAKVKRDRSRIAQEAESRGEVIR
ncbi:MAG: hypothetical protein AAFV43_11390 [Planctomycetota bacterium]